MNKWDGFALLHKECGKGVGLCRTEENVWFWECDCGSQWSIKIN